MISYRRLNVRLAEREMSKTDLRNKVGISTVTLAKFDKGEPVSLSVLEKICLTLGCRIEEIVEILPDESDGEEHEDQKK